jgi:hypothetical protein
MLRKPVRLSWEGLSGPLANKSVSSDRPESHPSRRLHQPWSYKRIETPLRREGWERVPTTTSECPLNAIRSPQARRRALEGHIEAETRVHKRSQRDDLS